MCHAPRTRHLLEWAEIRQEGDIIRVRRLLRRIAREQGYRVTDVTRIVTAASELARNIYTYAHSGRVTIFTVEDLDRRGLELVFEDDGPGIADPEQAMEAGFSSGRGLGLGLPGARRLMNEFLLETSLGRGTRVTVRKWRAQ